MLKILKFFGSYRKYIYISTENFNKLLSMHKDTKLKIILGTIYVLIISVFLWVFFSYFSISELTSYEFIKNNRDYLIQVKNSNFLFTSVLFLIFTILWVLLLGFGSPVFLLGGFIFGKWYGSLLTIFAISLGATFLYMFANFFLKEFIEKKFSKRFSTLNEKFRKNEFLYFLIYRFVGGIPFAISNILPVIFNIRLKTFFVGSILGIYPQAFIWVSLGSGIEKIIYENIKAPTIFELILSREIYLPITAFLFLLALTFIFRKLFFRN